jgi:hypothetical protein
MADARCSHELGALVGKQNDRYRVERIVKFQEFALDLVCANSRS